MTTPQLLSGATIAVYRGDVGETATVITPATGVIAPDAADWDQTGLGPWNNGCTVEMQDERTPLMYQGSRGRASQYRRTVQGFMAVLPNFNMTVDMMDLAWGAGITDTAAGAAQVGIKRVGLDLPLVVPEHGIQLVIDSPYDTDGTRPYKSLVYLPKASISIAGMNLAVDAPDEGVEMTIMQMDHASAAFWDMVYAPAA